MEFLVGDIDRECVEGNGTAKVEMARFVGDLNGDCEGEGVGSFDLNGDVKEGRVGSCARGT